MRHIAVVGMSFCGSTMLSHVLGAFNGVYNVGESWFLEHTEIFCNACGRDCEVLTPDFLTSLKRDRTNWYARLGAQAGAQILVSSDKNMDILRSLDPEMDFDAVYCFRPPLEAYRSYVRVMTTQEPDGDKLDLQGYLNYWAQFYKGMHYDFKIKGRKVWVDFREFQHNPLVELNRLCGKLELPYDANALEFWRVRQHSIGGNFNPYDALRLGKMDKITIGPRPTPEFSLAELKGYEEQVLARGMFDAMRRWSLA